ncbi:MAG: sodium-dependent transporter [Deltaproteobacteria bacterium]|nr:sodium-dependent transporter [Deltaproteobacteria bacterium]
MQDRGSWSSRFGFVMAAVGSAVGLGNIWRFPYYTGTHGGAAFVFVYLLAVIILGIPLLITEIAVGRASNKNPVGAFKTLAPNSRWYLVGILGVVTGIVILSYYSVIAGWVFGYIFITLSNKFSGADEQIISYIFQTVSGSPIIPLILLLIIIGFTTYIVSKGIQSGIERYTKVLMPVLFFLLIILAIRSLTLPNAIRGIEFYLSPDLSKIDAKVIAAALGQAFFSLSLGMGAILTYGSYLAKRENIFGCSAWIAFSDTLVAIVAGFVIFPAVFSVEGLSPADGPALIFKVLPIVISKMPGGLIFGTALFVLLTIAAVTSTISLLEVGTSFLIDEYNIERKRAAYILGGISFILGIFSALSCGAVGFLSKLPFLGIDFLSLMDVIFGNISLIFGSLCIALFAGYKWKVDNIIAEIESENVNFKFRMLYKVLIKYIVPLLILLVFVNFIVETFLKL